MRRLLVWGRQDPLLPCPAEAASPPPLSAFRSPCASATALPCADLVPLFSSIERQLSAKLTAEPLFGQCSPPQPSPPDATEFAATIASQLPPASDLLAAATTAAQPRPACPQAEERPLHGQQQQNENGTPAAAKGLDAFFAALTNSNPSTTAPSYLSAGGTILPAQQPPPELTAQLQNQQMNPSGRQQPTSMRHPGIMGQTQQQMAEAVASANNDLATATNLFVNAALAAQQRQTLMDTPSLLARLKPSLLQPMPSHNQQQQQMETMAQQQNNNELESALQQAIQQKQHQQQSPLSPEEIVQAGIPVLLDRLTGGPRNILRPGPSQSKPIPLLEERVDLLRFRRKEPREWSSDDVIAWILDVARRHQIPCENLNLAKFATCSGPLLMLMNEQSFKEHDPNFGSLLFGEFCKLVTDESFIDEWMLRSAVAVTGAGCPSLAEQPTGNGQMVANNLMGQLRLPKLEQSEQQPGPSAAQQSPNLLLAAAAGIAAVQHQQQQQQQKGIPPLSQLLAPSVTPSLFCLQQRPSVQPPVVPSAMASLSKMLQPHQQYMATVGPNPSGLLAMGGPGTSAAFPSITPAEVRPSARGPSTKLAEQKIRRNKDGRPRKRSQHTKGNKLWEFIRDALKDPRTSPSIVRWEDPSEGVFRIVESERLAFLWGQKKNNQKMTYEKLSRAMRTYYEKEILVPVPKSGLYPKKLVYKFGPSALGWKVSAQLAIQSQLATGNRSSIPM